jgi:photosystem I P700 chlorophyll a apoprotein A2
MYSLNPYPYLSFSTSIALYVHHQFIATSLLSGACVHISIFIIRDATFYRTQALSILEFILNTKSHCISLLSYVTLFVGFHLLGVFSHNDTVVGFGDTESQIIIEPILLISLKNVVGAYTNPLGFGDLMSHHAISFAVHVSTLIFVRSSLDGKSSVLVPDKFMLGVSFACDGPNRGGT